MVLQLHLAEFHLNSLPLLPLQCGPCRQFTPTLAKFYSKAKETGKKFEVVFASSDNSDEEFKDYLATMPWWAIPYGDKRKKLLSKRFEVEGKSVFRTGVFALGGENFFERTSEQIVCEAHPHGGLEVFPAEIF